MLINYRELNDYSMLYDHCSATILILIYNILYYGTNTLTSVEIHSITIIHSINLRGREGIICNK